MELGGVKKKSWDYKGLKEIFAMELMILKC
jgi:hypothetical protein